MKRKILALFIAFALLLPLCPASVVQAADGGLPEDIIRSAAEKLYDNYAAAHTRSGSADGAVEDFLKRSLYGKGVDWALSPGSNTVATIFGSEVFRESMINVITETLLLMESSGEDVFHSYGKTGWHNYYHMYSYLGFRNDFQDYDRFAGTITDTELIYGSPAYVGPTNRNDDALEIIAGDLFIGYTFRRSSVTQESTTYTIDLHLFDNFDFDGNYNHIGEEGFDTSVDSALKGLGKLLAVMLITEFHWYFKESFTIEIPNSCNHTFSHFSWTPGEVNDSYYTLSEAITLSHDRPWVVEYVSDGAEPLVLSCTKYTDSVYPMLMELDGSIWAHHYELVWLTAEEIAASGVPDAHSFRYHYYGRSLCSDGLRKVRLENCPNEDGSNMIYVSVLDANGNIIMDKAPMDGHFSRMKGKSELSVDEESGSIGVDRLDFVINYIGNKSYPLPSGLQELSIYPCGEGAQEDSMIDSIYLAPGCTAPGSTTHICRSCGLSYVTDETEALGHNFGEYQSDNNASCTTEGTISSHCSRCDEVRLSEEKTPALGHSWDEGSITQPPSSSTEGLRTYSCTRCGEVKTESIEKLPSGLFTDVPEGSWYEEAVYWAVSKGITNGIGEGLLGPGKSCTRAQVVTFLWRAAGEPEVLSSENPFDDVRESDYYYEAVLWALEKGITTGTSDSSFSPADGCTRAQVAAFLWRALGSPEAEAENPFEDVSDEAWYRDAVLWALTEGVTTGTSDTSFSPASSCTRAQIACFLWRAYTNN